MYGTCVILASPLENSSTVDRNWRRIMAIFDSQASKSKHFRTPQFRRGFGLLGAGLFLTSIALIWHPTVIFSGEDWTERLHRAVMAVGMILEVTGMILCVISLFKSDSSEL
jgi:hypothetical protein